MFGPDPNAIPPAAFVRHVTHHYEFLGDKLIIGKFCAIGKGVEFIMHGAAHRMSSVTAYPLTAAVEAELDMDLIDLGIAKLRFAVEAGGHFEFGQNGKFVKD